MNERVLIRGSGDVGSAVAHLLSGWGYAVVIHDEPAPAAPRRGMAFTDAVFDGSAYLEGVEGRKVERSGDLVEALGAHQTVPIFTGELGEAIGALRPSVVVDARMRKRVLPEPQLDLARLTVALGPNCEAGITAHAVIETQWGDRLGEVLWAGRTRELAGEPQTYGGHARARFVYAPVGGPFASGYGIGDPVRSGEVVAHVGQTPLAAPLDGILRGLVRSGVEVSEGAKVVEVDPRADVSKVFGIGSRPARIAEGVLEAIEQGLRR
ncbi:MAG: xanthine dehydrogenase [Actinomycetota bacterium]